MASKSNVERGIGYRTRITTKTGLPKSKLEMFNQHGNFIALAIIK